MLKTIRLPDKPVFSRNNGSRLTSNKNNNNKLALRKNNDNSKDNEFGINRNSVKYAKKSEKLSKLRKSKGKKISKFQNLAKSRKKLLKSGNPSNFNATEAALKFLTSDARTAFNHLWLTFIEASIL